MEENKIITVAPDEVLKKPNPITRGFYNAAKERIHSNLETIATAAQEIWKDLAKIRENHWYRYDGYLTYEEFCLKELGKSRRHINRLLEAHEVTTRLLDAGVSKEDLPGNEKLCRAIRTEVPEERWAELWEAVKANTKAAGKTMPNVSDVTRAAQKLSGEASDQEAIHEKIMGQLRKAKKALQVSIPFDALTLAHRAELISVISQIESTATTLRQSLASKVVAERAAALNDKEEETGTKAA